MIRYDRLAGSAILVMMLATAACDGFDRPVEPAPAPASAPPGGQDSAVGLALEIENGQGVPLTVRAGQTFYIDHLDLRAAVTSNEDRGVNGLTLAGDFASLDWRGIAFEEAGPPLANPDGTFTRRRFYRGAKWMKAESTFQITPVNSAGAPVAAPVVLSAGEDDHRDESDTFFVRRLRAIQWTRDCVSATSCAGATAFEEEALVELRNAMEPAAAFSLPPQAAALRVAWSEKPGPAYLIPVTQVADSMYDYGFRIDVTPLTPPGPQGFYAPGEAVTFQLTLRDGAGTALHPPGSLPTYDDVISGRDQSGIQYYRAFFDPTATYWRRKHREHMLMAQIIGPAQSIQPIRSVLELPPFLGLDDVQTVGVLARDGVYSQFQTFPPANDLFGGAFDPAHAGWSAPVSDTFTFDLPDDAPAGTYLVTVKGRRVYLGEAVSYTRTIEIQVDSTTRTHATLDTGRCNECHADGGELSSVLHGNDNRAACAGCHAPLAFELEGPIVVRTHFIHSRSRRVGEKAIERCANCHLGAASIQRTSKAACMSCHTSYPADHVSNFGPVVDVYIGGGAESFQQCTAECHATHPNSGL